MNIATEKLSVSYDESKVKSQDIQRAIEKAGYGVIRRNKFKSKYNTYFWNDLCIMCESS